MKRIVGGAVALGAVAVLVAVGAGWTIGGKAESGYRRALTGLESRLPGVQLENASYERGIFRSRVLTEVQSEKKKVLLEHRIDHLPRTRVRVETRFLPGDEISDLFDEGGLKRLFETPLVTEVDFSGRSSSRYALKGFDHAFDTVDGRSFVLESGDLELVVDLSADLASGRGHFNLPSLRLAGDGALLELEGVSSHFNSSEKKGLTVGQSRAKMESFSFELDQEPKYAAIAVRGLDMASRNDIADGFYGGTMQLRAGTMTLGAEDYGPLEMEMALERLPVGPLQRFQKEMESLNRSGAAGAQEAQMRFLMAMGEIVPRLLGDQPRLVLKKISMRGRQGEINGRGFVTVAEGAVSTDLQQQLASLIGNIDVRLQRDLLKSLIMSSRHLKAGRRAGADEQLDEMIARDAGSTIRQLQARNILVEEGDYLKLNLHLEELQLTLNGAPVPL